MEYLGDCRRILIIKNSRSKGNYACESRVGDRVTYSVKTGMYVLAAIQSISDEKTEHRDNRDYSSKVERPAFTSKRKVTGWLRVQIPLVPRDGIPERSKGEDLRSSA